MFNDFHITKAIAIAQKANVKRAKVSALAFNKHGALISFAHNRCVRGHPQHWTEHAEEALIRKLDKINAFNRFGKIFILVLRINTKGLVTAKPCKRCCRILRNRNLKIFYTDNGKICEMRF